MTTAEAELILFEMFGPRQTLCITGVSWGAGVPIKFEADFLSITTAGYATVVEIKVSVADLRKDIRKLHIKNPAGFYDGIKHMYYAVPEDLIGKALNQIPKHFGLINLTNRTYVRKAEEINKYKWSEAQRLSACRLLSLRCYSLKKKLHEQKNL